MQYEKTEVPREQMVPVEQMNKEEMLMVLYDAAIRHTKDAMAQIDSGQVPAEELFSLGKAFGIVEQFMISLDYERAPELCEGLYEIYQSMQFQMHKAYDDMVSEPLIPVVQALSELRQTWAEAMDIAAGNKVAPEA